MPRWPLLLLLALPACSAETRDPAPADGTVVVDTVLPPEEALARFRANLPEVTALEGGLPSREALVEAYVAALASRDTTTLGRLHLSAAEFAWLYYPHSMQAREPTYLPADLAWFMTRGRTDADLPRLLEQVAGHRLEYRGHACSTVRDEGPNRVHGHCLTRVAVDGAEEAQGLHGLILERDGQFKFVNYATRLD